MTKQLVALIARIKRQTESFDTVVLKEDEANVLIAALEQAQQQLATQRQYYEGVISDGNKRIAELENDEVHQRLANAEHQLYMAELAKHNLKASRKAQFRKRLAAEKRIAELEQSHAQVIHARDHYKRVASEGIQSLAEARKLTVKLPKLYGIDFCDRIEPDEKNGFLFYSEQVIEAILAAGIALDTGEQNNG